MLLMPNPSVINRTFVKFNTVELIVSSLTFDRRHFLASHERPAHFLSRDARNNKRNNRYEHRGRNKMSVRVV